MENPIPTAQTELLASTFLNYAGALVVILDHNGCIIQFNRASEKLSGLTFDEVKGKFPWDTFLPPEDAETIRKNAFEVLANNPQAMSGSYTNYWMIKHGGRALIEWVNTVVLDDQQRMSYLVSVGTDITQRKLDEQKLKNSERRLKEAQHIARVGSWELDLVNNELLWSDEIFNIFEIDQTKFGASYEAFLDAIHPDDRDMVNKAYSDSLVDRSPYEIAHRLKMNNGSIKYVRESCESYFDTHGKPVRSIGTIQDITKLHIAEKELQQHRDHLEELVIERTHALAESEERLRSLFELSPIGIALNNFSTGDFTELNDALIAPTGYTKKEFIGLSYWDITPKKYEQQEALQLESLEKTGRYGPYEKEYIRKDGSRYPVLLNGMLTKDSSGNKMIWSMVEDISNRKQAENSLKESEEMFRALFEQAGGYCMILQPTDSGIPVIIDVNEAACREHGYTRSEMIGKPVADLDDEEGKRTIIERTKSIMSGKPLIIETEHVRKDGSTFPVSVCANRIQIGNKPALILTTEYNISNIKKAEAERRHAEEIARENLVALSHVTRLATMGEMATGIAHELNQPLTAINTFANVALKLMQGGNKKPAMLTDALEGISSQAMHAGDIIRQLRAHVQKESPQMMVTDLNTLVKEVIVLIEPDLKKQDVKLHLELAEQLPQVTVSGIEIQQVLVNLIRNAVDAMQESPAGLRELVVSTRLAEQSKIVVTVTDTGIGMDKETLDHIFDPFFTTKGNEGIGVGLSISHSIIQAHGGTLSAQAQSGSGASFSFTLPTNH